MKHKGTHPSHFRRLCGLLLIFTVVLVAPRMSASEDSPRLHVIQDSLEQQGNFYCVKGSIYNPYDRGVANVVVKYYVWKKWMGQDGHGSRIKETGGLLTAMIKYIPPKGTVQFETASSDNAAIMLHDIPDPIDAVIDAKWDQ